MKRKMDRTVFRTIRPLFDLTIIYHHPRCAWGHALEIFITASASYSFLIFSLSLLRVRGFAFDLVRLPSCRCSTEKGLQPGVFQTQPQTFWEDLAFPHVWAPSFAPVQLVGSSIGAKHAGSYERNINNTSGPSLGLVLDPILEANGSRVSPQPDFEVWGDSSGPTDGGKQSLSWVCVWCDFLRSL